MALLRRVVPKRMLPLQHSPLSTSTRLASAKLLQDYIAGPYPKTEKERLEAAKKYGLLPHEYKPIADDGFGNGDYPDLPHIGDDSKDPYYPWDYPEYKRNYNEVMHINADMYREDRYDPMRKWPVPRYAMVLMFLGVVSAVTVMAILIDPYRCHRPVCQKQYPYQGKVHYSFEREN